MVSAVDIRPTHFSLTMKISITILYIFVQAVLFSQGGFKRQFKLPGVITNQSKGIYQKPNGEYIAGGIIVDTILGHISNRLVIMGLDANGQLQWTKKYGNYKFEYYDKLVAPWFYFDGNFLYHSGVAKDSNNKIIGVFVKFNLNGDTIWQKRFYDTLPYTIPQMVTKSVDGGYLLTGLFGDPNVINSPLMLIKTDASGNEIWRKKINKVFPNAQEGKAIIQDSATKKIVIVGEQSIGNVNGWGPHDNILILDSLGNYLTQHNFAGPDGGILTDLVQTKDGKFVAVGQKIFPQQIGGTNLTKGFAVKFDVNTPNPPIWKLSFDKLLLTNYFTCITELENEDLLIGGTIDTLQLHNMLPNFFTRLTILNKSGQLKSNKYYNYKNNSPSTDNFQAILCLNPTTDKGFIAAINVQNTPNPNPFFFVKFDSTGCDSTEEYCQMMAEVGFEEFQASSLTFQIWPNPAGNYFSLETENFYEGQVVLKMFDVLGSEVKRKNIHLPAEVDISDLSQGVYLISLLNVKNELLFQSKLIKQE